MKRLAFLTVIIIGILLLWAESDLPRFGDPDTPSRTYVAGEYLERSLEDTGTENVVTAILAGYRGFDTLGELTVVFTGFVAVTLLIRRGGRL